MQFVVADFHEIRLTRPVLTHTEFKIASEEAAQLVISGSANLHDTVDRLVDVAEERNHFGFDGDITQAELAAAFGAAAAHTTRSDVPSIYDSEVKIIDHDRVSELAALPPVQYDRQRKTVAEELGIRTATLDREVEAKRRNGKDSYAQGRELDLPDRELWPEPVEGAELLAELSAEILRYVVMPTEAADTAALWIAHTYLTHCFPISPRLAIPSPVKGCGKTTFLDVLSTVVRRPLMSANISSAAVFRTVEKIRPTFLLDEADTFLKDNDELRGVLNAGHRKGGTVIRSVGDQHEPRAFSVFCACGIALIGALPDTLEDRSIKIELRRRKADEPIERFRFDRTNRLHRLGQMAARWALDNEIAIKSTEPDVGKLFNREADNWRPFLAIADVAGSEWPERARKFAYAGTAAEAPSIRITLLADIKKVFEQQKVDKLQSAALAASLAAMDSRPWADWKAGKAITPTAIARLLRDFSIGPATHRDGKDTWKGYCLVDFGDAFDRYLPAEIVTPSQSPKNKNNPSVSEPSHEHDCDGSECAVDPTESPIVTM